MTNTSSASNGRGGAAQNEHRVGFVEPKSDTQSARRLVVIVGNPRPASRTHTIALQAAKAVAQQISEPISQEIIDLTLLAPRLLQPGPCIPVEDALEQVTTADILIVASPTYKGTYTGLLKVFLDRLPGAALKGKIALPLLVMGSPRHALAVEVHLRPLLVELGATVPTPGLAVLESDLDHLEEVLNQWTHAVGVIA